VVTEKLLLEGAVYALENGADLLRDAVALFERGSYSSAVAMAMLAREEFGKYRMLRTAFEKVAGGETLDPKQLRKDCRDHVTKQESGVLSVVQRPEPGTREEHLLRAMFDLPLNSPDRQKVDQELEKITKAIAKKLPKRRHDLRLDALYVNLSEDESRWVRPRETMDTFEARLEVEHAIGDYNTLQFNLQEGLIKQSAFLAYFRGWPDRPALSPVDIPRLAVEHGRVASPT
jgi:AbiV family abortive infection protein